MKSDLAKSYSSFVASLKERFGSQDAMRQAIGAEFDSFGVLERQVLIQYGLRPDHYVIDVGCGSGRLAKPLSQYLQGPYLGIDLVPELLDHARELVERPDWRFELAPGLTIPEKDGAADFVCFFSVFTHLLHEQSYSYLLEAKRVLKPSGKIIFTFLEFAMACHWDVFAANLEEAHREHPLNMFLSRDAVRTWADHLRLRVEAIDDCDNPSVPLSEPLRLDDGRVFHDRASLGQTICVLAMN
jgi:SAM-dependent methyltransferase